MLPISLDCQFLITLSVFFIVYFAVFLLYRGMSKFNQLVSSATRPLEIKHLHIKQSADRYKYLSTRWCYQI